MRVTVWRVAWAVTGVVLLAAVVVGVSAGSALGQNAAQEQYGTPTPPPSDLPFTGSELVPWLLLAGCLTIAVGAIVRGWQGRLK